jgi:hypothetical protein
MGSGGLDDRAQLDTVIGGLVGLGPTNSGELVGWLGRRHRNVPQYPFQPRDLAQLSCHVHGGQHGDAPDKRSEGGMAAIYMEHEKTADHVEESDGEQGRRYRVRER